MCTSTLYNPSIKKNNNVKIPDASVWETAGASNFVDLVSPSNDLVRWPSFGDIDLAFPARKQLAATYRCLKYSRTHTSHQTAVEFRVGGVSKDVRTGNVMGQGKDLNGKFVFLSARWESVFFEFYKVGFIFFSLVGITGLGK